MINQPGETVFVGPHAADFALLGANLLRDFRQHPGAGLFFPLQHLFLRRLFRGDADDGCGFGSDFVPQAVDFAQVRAQPFQQLRPRPRHVAQIVQLPRHFAGMLAAQYQPQGFRFALHVLVAQHAAEQILLRTQCGAGFPRRFAQCPELGIGIARLPVQRVQFAIGLGNGPLRFAQRVGCLAFGFFRCVEFFLQRADAVAQLAQLGLGLGGIGCCRCGARQQHERKDERQPLCAGDHVNSSRERPVITAGCGSPMMASRVGATSCSAPPFAMRALRPT